MFLHALAGTVELKVVILFCVFSTYDWIKQSKRYCHTAVSRKRVFNADIRHILRMDHSHNNNGKKLKEIVSAHVSIRLFRIPVARKTSVDSAEITWIVDTLLNVNSS